MSVREPTLFDKLKMGAVMGGTVGLCIGLVFGTVNVVRFGPGQHGYLGTLGRSMASSAGFFGLLMAVGAVVRSEEARPLPFASIHNANSATLGGWRRRADGSIERVVNLGANEIAVEAIPKEKPH